MQIELDVVGGANGTCRFTMSIDGEQAGELIIERLNFTRFCDKMFDSNYKITSKNVQLQGKSEEVEGE